MIRYEWKFVRADSCDALQYVCMCMCVRACACVREKERERVRRKGRHATGRHELAQDRLVDMSHKRPKRV